MRKIVLIILVITLSNSTFANKTTVTTASAINNGSWSAGDTIVMKNGTWTNQSILFKAIGTEAKPVVLMAETPGTVILNGTSKLGFSGKYIEISGLYFKNGILSTSDVISFRFSNSDLAENCRLTNTVIENYNPTDNTISNKWVSIYGKNNRVDHCSFVNKNNSGTLLVVWLESGITVNHQIKDNYFGYRNANLDENGDELNGQEIIRIGDSYTSMTTANVTVEGNFFEHCNGEIEIISNKSCGNTYKNNLFLECSGMLTLRHGNNCTVDGNYFFGNGVSKSGGVRIIGENHKVYNNYFEKLTGEDYRSAICLVRGKEDSELYEYFQVKNAIVEFNTMVDCSQSFSINYNSSSDLTMSPVGSIIAHNHVYNTSSSNLNVKIDQTNVSDMDITWKNNLMNQGKYTAFSYNLSQIITGKDAKMTVVNTPINMYEPGYNSQLSSYVTDENADVTTDIRGRLRGTSKIPGVSQLSGEITSEMPVKTAVGASFYNNSVTFVKSISEENFLKISIINHQLSVFSSVEGKLQIVNMSGKFLFNANIKSDETKMLDLISGFYIVQIKTDKGKKQVKKVFI